MNNIFNDDKLYEYKTINSRGATIHLIKMKDENHWKFHKWDGPAIIPHSSDSEFKKTEYHINGVPYDEDEYKQIMRGRSGLPYYKQASFRGTRV